MKFENKDKHLVGNVMYHYNCGKVPDIFSHIFSIEIVILISTIRELPITFIFLPLKTYLGKTGIKYTGAVNWYIIVKDAINADVSETELKIFESW